MSRATPVGDHLARQIVDRMGAALDERPVLVTCDFDGTVSVPRLDPWAATILPAAQRALRSLAALDGVHVAFLSGRTAADLSRRVRVGGADYLGNQGLERARLRRGQRHHTLVVEPHPAPPDAWHAARLLSDEVPRSIPWPWLIVEPKGPAVTFHYRGAPDVRLAAEHVAGAVDMLDPTAILVRFPGRRSLELRPRGAPAKGETFRALLETVRPRVAFMLGDDRTDVPAFRELRDARARGELMGMAIAVGTDLSILAETTADADTVLATPAVAGRFLGLLARRLSS